MKKHIILFLTLLTSITTNSAWGMKKVKKDPENMDPNELIKAVCEEKNYPYLKYKDSVFIIKKEVLPKCEKLKNKEFLDITEEFKGEKNVGQDIEMFENLE